MTSPPAVRFGVLGCSSVAWRRTLPAIAASSDCELAAVASRDPDKAARFAAQFSCDAEDYESLLARSDLDAIYLPLPPALHATWGSEVLRRGMHLLCEKPIAVTALQARDLIRLAGERRLVLRENFAFLHHEQHARVRELVAAGELGVIRSFTAAFCFPPLPDTDIRYDPVLGGGALLDAGVYPLRAAQLLLGNDLTVVGASLVTDTERGVDLAGQVQVVSAAGVLGALGFGFLHAYGSRYELWGSTARLSVDRAFSPPPDWHPVLRIEGQDRTEDHVLAPANQFARSVTSFARAVRAGEWVTSPAEAGVAADTVRTMELTDEIRRVATIHAA
jgi:dTDP-3,4-didehydro-2,6-dideoxy-alpha-D-glucose 3-reductase